MRNAFGFLPCRYECGSVPFSPSIFFFFFLGGGGGELLKLLQLLLHHGAVSPSQPAPRVLGRQRPHVLSTRSRRQIKD